MRWKNFPIVRRLKDDFCEVVMLDNDGNLGAFAEQRCGVAQGLKHVLYMTVSSGCGGGLLIDGEIYHGAGDGAAEVGHMSIDPEGPPCPCGSKGCFELYASGTALIGFMKKDMASGVKSRVFELAGYEEERLNGELLTLAARERDAYALELYRREGYYLGVGLSNLINLFDPQAVVLGGGVTKAAGFFEKELISTLKKRCIQSVHDGLIRYSKLNDLVILHGAYFMIKEYMEKNKLEEI
jgi:glucokinase